MLNLSSCYEKNLEIIIYMNNLVKTLFNILNNAGN